MKDKIELRKAFEKAQKYGNICRKIYIDYAELLFT